VFGFDFKNAISYSSLHVKLNKNEDRYTITSDGSMPNLKPHETIEFSLYFYKQVNDSLSNLTINNQPICDNYLPAPTEPPITPPPTEPPVTPPAANEWNPFASYSTGDTVTYQGKQYVALITFQGHGDPSWSPANAATIWRPL